MNVKTNNEKIDHSAHYNIMNRIIIILFITVAYRDYTFGEIYNPLVAARHNNLVRPEE